jgi:dephospho-CoA kinase
VLIVGLTGGIASGKSTVERLFASHGIPVIDADAIAKDLVRPGEPGLADIVREFGPQVLTDDGHLDRKKMAARVFSDPDSRKRLETILHPLVREQMTDALTRIDSPYTILSAPLLLESGQDDLVDRILVVDLPPTLQRQRLQARDGRSEHQINLIMAAQMARNARCRAADDLIDNSSSLNDLQTQVNHHHHRYLELARAH